MEIIKVEIIKNYMINNNLSKKSVCKLCKISYETLQKILHNQYNFRVNAIFKVAKFLNVEVTELFNDNKK